MTEQWQELKETITEMRDSNGTCTQQEVCEFLVNYMEILEKQMQEPKTGHWICIDDYHIGKFKCSVCQTEGFPNTAMYEPTWNYCPNCGAKMER